MALLAAAPHHIRPQKRKKNQHEQKKSMYGIVVLVNWDRMFALRVRRARVRTQAVKRFINRWPQEAVASLAHVLFLSRF